MLELIVVLALGYVLVYVVGFALGFRSGQKKALENLTIKE